MARLKSAQNVRPSVSRHLRGYGNDWQIARRNVIEAWVRHNGWVCPGYRIPRHSVERGKLTGDHRVPVAMGGSIADGIDVLCQPCNTARGQDTLRELRMLR